MEGARDGRLRPCRLLRARPPRLPPRPTQPLPLWCVRDLSSPVPSSLNPNLPLRSRRFSRIARSSSDSCCCALDPAVVLRRCYTRHVVTERSVV
ncbi:hypothetical protein BHE74_00047610 [Ensete ventricosum]|nr:hypothetical protein GW17_00024896 [Ensete ventricosum]RWW46463.1 hypothetical protein BHE74_00047610 [Ensete ventricosum]